MYTKNINNIGVVFYLLFYLLYNQAIHNNSKVYNIMKIPRICSNNGFVLCVMTKLLTLK